MGAELEGELAALLADLADDDVAAAAAGKDLDDGEADGATAEDEGGVALAEGGDVDGVPADGEGLDEGTDFEGDVVGELLDSSVGDDGGLGQAAAPAAETDEAVAVAAVDETAGAGAAVTVVDDGLNADAVALLDVGDALADLLNNTGEFVAKGDGVGLVGDGMRLAGLGDQVGTAEVLVEVGSADAAELRGNLDLAGRDGWDGDVVETDVLLAVEAEGLHGRRGLSYEGEGGRPGLDLDLLHR